MSQPSPSSVREPKMGPKYDVFLSHHSSDKNVVEEIAIRLEEMELKPFLDKWHLVPGDPWQEELEMALDQSATCAVFLGPNGIGGWQNEEMRSALDDRVRYARFRVIPVFLPRAADCDRKLLPRFLRRLTWVDLRSGIDDADAFGNLVAGIRGVPAHRTPRKRRSKLVIVLSGTIDEADRARVEGIAEHLRQISGDLGLTITKVESGSIRLTVECSEEGSRRIRDVFRDLPWEIQGRTVLDVKLQRADSRRYFSSLGYPSTISRTELSSWEATLGHKLPSPRSTLNYLSTLLKSESPLELYDRDLDATSVLAESIVNRSAEAIAEGVNVEALKRGINYATDSVVSEIRNLAGSADFDTLQTIAKVSTQGDQLLGLSVAKAVNRIGNRASIIVEDQKDSHPALPSLEFVNGLRFERGYLNASFVTDTERMEVVLDNPSILVYKNRLYSMDALRPVLEQARLLGRPLLVIAPDIEGEALATLWVNTLRSTLKVAAIKTPGAGQLQHDMSHDIALLTGARLIASSSDLQTIERGDLGSARKVVIGRDTTTIVEAGGDPAVVEQHFNNLRGLAATATSSYDRSILKARLAVPLELAVLGTGAAAGQKNERNLVENALASTIAARQEGIVPSAEISFLYVQRALLNQQLSDPDEERGFNIVVDALADPLLALVEDLGEDAEMVIDLLSRLAFNNVKGVTELFAKSESIDAARVVCAAVDTAAQLAMSGLKLDFHSHLGSEEERSGGATAI